jgi:L,D-peptidoglycan transpeptidase YkuD (ErfK/YbiS/YcfS/YnhG family)
MSGFRIWATIFLVACLLVNTLGQEEKRAKTSQVVFVVSDNWDSDSGELFAFEYQKEGLVSVFRGIPVTLGSAGTGIGLGMHSAGMQGPEKREGDKRAPAGIFPLEFSFGTKPVEEFGKTGLHYKITSSADYWVDDAKSTFYNRLVNTDASKIRKDWSSAETLRRSDGLYDLVIVVGHNRSPRIIPGRGSAIFLHRWSAPGKPTIGCTAMAPDNLQKLWSWLDAKKMPLLVQGPRDFVKKLSPPPIASDQLEAILRP